MLQKLAWLTLCAIAVILGLVNDVVALPGILGFETYEKVWGVTVTVFLLALYLLVSLCAYMNGIHHDEVVRCAEAKRLLEEALLGRTRQSSKRKKP